MTHREAIKQWLSDIYLKNELIMDWGSGSKPVMRYIQFENCKFITLDKNLLITDDRKAMEHYTMDIEDRTTFMNQADSAFCVEVLEHTIHPQKVLDNIWHNLRPGGKIFISIPFMYPIHSEEDYHRFTENGLRKILEEAVFNDITIRPTVGDKGYIAEARK